MKVSWLQWFNPLLYLCLLLDRDVSYIILELIIQAIQKINFEILSHKPGFLKSDHIYMYIYIYIYIYNVCVIFFEWVNVLWKWNCWKQMCQHHDVIWLVGVWITRNENWRDFCREKVCQQHDNYNWVGVWNCVMRIVGNENWRDCVTERKCVNNMISEIE